MMSARYFPKMKKVYLDFAATTPVDPVVFKAMKPYFSSRFGNASEPHFLGQEARRAVEEARDTVATFLGALPEEIIFTSCATESINLSHKGLVESLIPNSGRAHIITSAIEHKAVLETCKHLEKSSVAQVNYLPVDKYGMVNIVDIEKAIKDETVLVSIMYVNNEVGTLQPISEIGQLIRRINIKRSKKSLNQIYFHTDATQAVQYFGCDVNRLGVDLLSLTGHKFYAPKGIGALYVRKNTPISRQQDGGGQEFKLRAGTENVPFIFGLGQALKLVINQRNQKSDYLKRLQGQLIDGVLKIPQVQLIGHPTKRAPHIVSFIVEGAEGESIVLHLSQKGIAASSGSACTSGIFGPSHVLTAMGIAPELSHGSVRFSFGKDTTESDVDYLLKVLPAAVDKLRRMAPKL